MDDTSAEIEGRRETEAQPQGSRPPAAFRLPPRHPVVVQFSQLQVAASVHFWKIPRNGYRRGIDFYSAARLPYILARAAEQFKKAHKRYPDLLNPESMTEKIFWSKFFRPMKVPETGNKLLTSRFIPKELQGAVTCPEIVWHSTVAKVPRGNEVEPGPYYLKASHGSDMFRRVVYPISEAEAETLDVEFAGYLTRQYGLHGGEWWYNSFQPELLLEKAIGAAELGTAWCYYVIGGEVALIAPFQKTPEGSRKAYLSPDWELLEDEKIPLMAEYVEPSQAAKDVMHSAARAIGAPLEFVRVDFLLDEDERPYLGEVTFTPGNALSRLSDSLDLALGRLWNLAGVL